MDRRRAGGTLLVLAACIAYAAAAPTNSNYTALDVYDGTPEGCYYNFQHYGEGDRIMTNEPCLNCTCHNRMLMCYLRVCPFTKPIGQDCTVEKRADQCCPIVTCPDVPVDLLTSTTTSPAEYGGTGVGHPDKFGCTINGKYFSEGSKVPPTPNKPCEHCYCIRNMTTCVMQECTLHVDGCTPIYHKDVCCPVRYSCDHPEDEMPLLDDLSTTVRPTPGFILTTTVAPTTPMTQDCLYKNKVIPDGALIKTEEACNHCYCMIGDIVCVVQECGTPMENEGKNCTALAPREGVCCPDTYICEGDEPTTESYDGQDYTTESDLILTTLPSRRNDSEGSGYRIEQDGVIKTESPPPLFVTEGSGDDEIVTQEIPDSHLPKDTDVDTEVTASEIEDVTTESQKPKDISDSTNIPSTTSGFVDSGELITTKPQFEEIGSGEEDITTDKIIPTSFDETTKDNEYISDENVITTESSSSIEAHSTSSPGVHNDETSSPNVDADMKSTIAIDTVTTEETSLKTTANIPALHVDDKTTVLDKNHDITLKPEDYLTISTSAPGYDEDIATTEPQGYSEDYKGTEAEFEPHHQNTVTASTPLLEEIEKDTDQDDLSDKYKTSTTLPNIPEEPVRETDNKPDVLDETISTNIPTTISSLANDDLDITTSEPQPDEDLKTSVNEYDESEKTTPSDYNSTPKSQITQQMTLDESSKQDENILTTIKSILDEENDKTTLSSSITTLEPVSEYEETKLTSSTSSSLSVDDSEMSRTTLRESLSTLEPQTDPEQSSEHQTTVSETDLNEDKITKTIVSSSTESELGHDEIQVSSESTPTSKDSISDEELQDEKKTTPLSSEEENKPYTGEITESPTATTIKEESNEITTVEPDKGLNTIPSGSIDDETTDANRIPVEQDITTIDDELQNKFDGTTENIDISQQTTTSTHVLPDDQITTESAHKTSDEQNPTTANYIVDLTSTTVVSSEIIPSTESTINEISPVNEKTEHTSNSRDPTTITSYESSTQALETEPQIEDKYETTSSTIISESTTVNLQDNEIINEPRIPGEGDCLLNGVTFRNESSVPSSNKCQSGCRCISSIIKCDPIICSPPPEYMNNCQTVYDSLDSCCPTYVCDHKSETMPPQSHSQMSGTESPISPTKCKGNECILNENKKQPQEIVDSETPVSPTTCNGDECVQGEDKKQPAEESGTDISVSPEKCTGEECIQTEDKKQPEEGSGTEIPVSPEKCIGTECVQSEDKKQPEEGSGTEIPVSPVKCTGDECVLSEDKKQPAEESVSEIPVSPEKCTGTECVQSEDKKQPEEGSGTEIPVSPVKCTGDECVLSEDKKQPAEESVTEIPVSPEKCTGTECVQSEDKKQPEEGSGTDIPVSPVKCTGDECVLSEDKKQPAEESVSEIPVSPEKCTGTECVQSEDKKQPEEGSGTEIPVSPVKCTGDECVLSEDKKQPAEESVTEIPVSPEKCTGTECVQSEDKKQPEEGSGTDIPVSPVKCTGDECVLSEDKKQPAEESVTEIPVSPEKCTGTECVQSEDKKQPEEGSGTEIPVSPVKCTGDECILSEDKKQPAEESVTETPVSPEKCDGVECTQSGNQPIKPCEGTECDATTSATTEPQKLQPCANGKCDSDVDAPTSIPQEDLIEKECKENSCKRKDSDKLDQNIPEGCSGTDCDKIKPDHELTTSNPITSLNEMEQEKETKSTVYDNVTEKEEPHSTEAVIPTESIIEPTEETSSYETTSVKQTNSPLTEEITAKPEQEQTTLSDSAETTSTVPATFEEESEKPLLVPVHHDLEKPSHTTEYEDISTANPKPIENDSQSQTGTSETTDRAIEEATSVTDSESITVHPVSDIEQSTIKQSSDTEAEDIIKSELPTTKPTESQDKIITSLNDEQITQSPIYKPDEETTTHSSSEPEENEVNYSDNTKPSEIVPTEDTTVTLPDTLSSNASDLPNTQPGETINDDIMSTPPTSVAVQKSTISDEKIEIDTTKSSLFENTQPQEESTTYRSDKPLNVELSELTTQSTAINEETSKTIPQQSSESYDEIPKTTEPSKEIESKTTVQHAITESSTTSDLTESSEFITTDKQEDKEITSIKNIEEAVTESLQPNLVSTDYPYVPEKCKGDECISTEDKKEPIKPPTVKPCIGTECDISTSVEHESDKQDTTASPMNEPEVTNFDEDKSTTTNVDTDSKQTTSSILTDAMRTESVPTISNEIATAADTDSKPTEDSTQLSTESSKVESSTSSILSINKEQDLTTLVDKQATESYVDIVTSQVSTTTTPETEQTDKTVSEPTKDYATNTPADELAPSTIISTLNEEIPTASPVQEMDKEIEPEIVSNDQTTMSSSTGQSEESLEITTEVNISKPENIDHFTETPTDKLIIPESESMKPETEAPYIIEVSTSLPTEKSSVQPDEATTETENKATETTVVVTTEAAIKESDTENVLNAEITTSEAVEPTTETTKIFTNVPTADLVTPSEPVKSTAFENDYSKSTLDNRIHTDSTSPGDVDEDTSLETSTKPDNLQTDTIVDNEIRTEHSVDNLTTESADALGTEKTHEVTTESNEQIDNVDKTTPESNQFKPKPTSDDIENGQQPTSIAPLETSHEVTNTPENSESVTEAEIVTTQSKLESESTDQTSTSKLGYPEISTTVSIIDSDQHSTESSPVSQDTTTIKSETVTEIFGDDLITTKPVLQETTLYDKIETQPPTSAPVPAEVATEADQGITTTESPVDDAQPETTISLDLNKATTPETHDVEVQTDIPTTSSEKPSFVSSTQISEHEEEKSTTIHAEEITTMSPLLDKFTKPALREPTEPAASEQPGPIPTEEPSPIPTEEQPRPIPTQEQPRPIPTKEPSPIPTEEQPRPIPTKEPSPIPTEEQPTDEIVSPDEEPTGPGNSGYGTDPDYVDEDQTFGPGTCRYGGKVYVSAQQIPRDDPCDFCFCFRSDIICLQQSCPPPIHGCHEEPISGFCCPRYECPVSMATTVNVTTTTTTTTTTLPPHFPVHSYKGSAQKRGCLIKGHSYKVGEVVRASSGPCLHCTCGGDGQMKCDPKQCTPEPMLRQMIAAAVSAKRRR